MSDVEKLKSGDKGWYYPPRALDIEFAPIPVTVVEVSDVPPAYLITVPSAGKHKKRLVPLSSVEKREDRPEPEE